MPPLIESLTRLASRMELYASGVDADRRDAELMLERRRPLDAREHARAILARIPDSAVGMALWADAAEAAWLDDEAFAALTTLSALVPWRADVWLRLGKVGRRLGSEGFRDALERAATAPDERASAREALLELCDLDLEAGDPARALKWLDRIYVDLTAKDEAVVLRRAEGLFALGRIEEGIALAEGLRDTLGEPASGPAETWPARRALVFARAAWAKLGLVAGRGGDSGKETARSDGAAPDPLLFAEALRQALRSYVLGAPGARELFAGIVSATTDAKTLAELRAIVAGAGDYQAPSFVAAFALAEGRSGDAREALLQALRGGDQAAAAPLLRLAAEAKDVAALRSLEERAAGALDEGAIALLGALAAIDAADPSRALLRLDAVAPSGPLGAWAAELRVTCFRALLDKPGARWEPVLDTLFAEARALEDAHAFTALETLSKDRARPISVAIVGEFNAGKSTFINALLGVDVAPTGILPTTATLHRVAWAPDPFARVLVHGAPDRTVSHADLKRTLSELGGQGAHIDRVQIYAPIERLRWVEILDTPGFNAIDPEHAKTAREAFVEADLVVWLLDGTGPLKASEAEILKGVAAMGLPVVALLNKADRLSDDDLARVLAHTRAGLGELGLRCEAGPLALSAKLALAGRLGDEAALARSRWSDVEAMISSTLVDQADRWRERGLARRAIGIVRGLEERARTRAAAAATSREARAARIARLREVAASLARDEGELAAKLRGAASVGERALVSDLRPLAALAEGAEGDLAMRSYAATRWVARLAEPLVAAFAAEQAIEPSEAMRGAVVVALESMALTFPLAAPSTEPSAQAVANAAWDRVFVAVVRALRRAVEETARALTLEAVEPHPQARLAALRAALSEVAEAVQPEAEANAEREGEQDQQKAGETPA